MLEQDTLILALVPVQPRKTSPFKTERLLMGHKESNQTNKNHHHRTDIAEQAMKNKALHSWQKIYILIKNEENTLNDVFEQLCRSACTYLHYDLHFCCLQFSNCNTDTCHIQAFKILADLCS